MITHRYRCVFGCKHMSLLSSVHEVDLSGCYLLFPLNLSIPSVHTFLIPSGQVPSNRVLLNAVQSEVSMCRWCVRARQQCVCVRMCVCFSPVLGRASLIGSQTWGISVLHNRVGRHREDGPRDSLGASEREASFWNTAPCYLTAQLSSQRTTTSTTSKRDLITMIVWSGLLHVYTLWTVTCHKYGKADWRCVFVCVFDQGCYRCFGAAVLCLETEEDVGMQWICQCSECWCVALQRWYKQVNRLFILTRYLFRLHVCVWTWNREHCLICPYIGKDFSAYICIDPNTGFAV